MTKIKSAPAAALLGVSSQTLRNMAHRGEIDYLRIGKQYFFPESEIKRLLEVQPKQQTA